MSNLNGLIEELRDGNSAIVGFPVLGGVGPTFSGGDPGEGEGEGDLDEGETWGSALKHLRTASQLAKSVGSWAKEIPSLVERVAEKSKEKKGHPKAVFGPQKTQEAELVEMARVISHSVNLAKSKMELVTIAMRNLAKGNTRRAAQLVGALKKGLDPALR